MSKAIDTLAPWVNDALQNSHATFEYDYKQRIIQTDSKKRRFVTLRNGARKYIQDTKAILPSKLGMHSYMNSANFDACCRKVRKYNKRK